MKDKDDFPGTGVQIEIKGDNFYLRVEVPQYVGDVAGRHVMDLFIQVGFKKGGINSPIPKHSAPELLPTLDSPASPATASMDASSRTPAHISAQVPVIEDAPLVSKGPIGQVDTADTEVHTVHTPEETIEAPIFERYDAKALSEVAGRVSGIRASAPKRGRAVPEPDAIDAIDAILDARREGAYLHLYPGIRYFYQQAVLAAQYE